jgi:hypothetical protein
MLIFSGKSRISSAMATYYHHNQGYDKFVSYQKYRWW